MTGEPAGPRELRGFPAAPGIAVGPAFVLEHGAVVVVRRSIADDALEAETHRLDRAVAAVVASMRAAREGLPSDAPAELAELIDAHALMASDPTLLECAFEELRVARVNAEWALREAARAICARLRSAGEPRFAERALDVEQVEARIQRELQGNEGRLPLLEEPAVLVARDLGPADLARLPRSSVLAVVTESGGATSHTAIVARGWGVPAVVGVEGVTRCVQSGEWLVVDGRSGALAVRPDVEALERARSDLELLVSFRRALVAEGVAAQARGLPGNSISLHANVQFEHEIPGALDAGAEGIGLFRTEFLYLGRDDAPSEADQFATYVRVLRALAPRRVVFRTFDLGGDKHVSERLGASRRARGLRGLRYALAHPELFSTQLRALLRASAHGPLAISLPMVTGPAELSLAKRRLEEIRADLRRAGHEAGSVEVGVMLEVPAAVLTLDLLAEQCDFFALGTNDLTQYTLALDRHDPGAAGVERGLDPAVLRLLRHAARGARRSRKALHVCGDLAADPVAVPLLVGLGLTTLSIPPLAFPVVREIARRVDPHQAAQAARRALRCRSSNEVETLVLEHFGERLGGLWAAEGLVLPRG